MSDFDQIVYRCQQGELAAFTALFAQCEARVYRLAVTILRNEQEAEDVVQDVFLRLFEQIKQFNGQAAFTTWLTTIVVNTCRDRLRRQKVRRAFSLDWIRGLASQQNVVEEVAQREERQQLLTLVHQLEEKYRLPIILHYYERMPCQEVAQVLNIPTSTVYSRLNTARVRLRTLVRTDFPQLVGRMVQER